MTNDPRSSESRRTVSETVLLATGAVVLAAFGYSISPILSPFVLFGAVIYLLYPMRDDPLPGRIIWLSVILFAIWFVYSLLSVLAPFIVAFLIAYILNPVVTRLEQRLPRWLSSLLVVLLFLGIVAALFVFAGPIIIRQFQSIMGGIGMIGQDLVAMIQSGALYNLLTSYGIPAEQLRELMANEVTPKLESLLTALFEGLFGFITGISSIVEQLINIVIIPFLVFYLLMDFPVVTDRFLTLAPPNRREPLLTIAGKVDDVLGSYLRGAVVVAIIQGTLSAFMLWVIGVNYALILGIMTGILNFIPYIGLLTSLVVSSIVACFSGEPVVAKVILVVILYLSQKVLEATILAPKIIGTKVGVHPVLLILCLLVFGHFLGFVGLLIAVPTTALLITAFREFEHRRDAVVTGAS
jgi:predicted PurR-regulated permease PerM